MTSIEAPTRPELPPDGLVAVVKEDCPTCRLVVPALRRMREAGVPLTVVTQDQPAFPEGVAPIDDRELAISWRLGVEAVPTLYRFERGVVRSRSVGWNRAEWRDVSGIGDLGADLPELRPGCGSRTTEPGMEERLRLRYQPGALRSRRVELGADEDAVEACRLLYRFEHGVVRSRSVGWNRAEWRDVSGIGDLGADLPELRPGCGSRTTEPGMEERLRLRFQPGALRSRRVELGADEDAVEACYSRGLDRRPAGGAADARARAAHALAARAATRTKWSRSCRPTWSSARSRRWRSTR